MKKIALLNVLKSTFILYCILFFLLVAQTMKCQIIDHGSVNENVIQAALKDFCGNDLTQKNGSLAKAGFDLALLFEEFKEHIRTNQLSTFQPSNSSLNVINDKVVVDIVAVNDPYVLKYELISAGMQIKGIACPIISGLLPINSIGIVAGLKDVRFFHPAICSRSVGLTTSQGDVAQRSDIVKSLKGYYGMGVTVGVLSDSYNYLGGASTDVLSGDLPGIGNPNGYTVPVNVLADDDSTTDEGRAMLQIIHDVAPASNLAFATANGGQAAFANNITNLRTNAGADVIVDDVFYYAEPFFQDGIIAQAVDNVVANGVAYFSSAGNQAKQSYESVWRSGPVLAAGSINGSTTFWGGTAFDFDPGPGVDYLQSFTLGNGQIIQIELQWDSPFASVCIGCPGSSNDLDLYFLNATGNYIYFSSAYNNVNADAFEYLEVSNNSGSSVTLNLMIVKYTGSDPGFLKYINFGDPQGNLQFATNSSTIFGHANAAGAEAVAAAAYYKTPEFGVNPPVLESFSSYGPTAIRFTTNGAPTFDPRSDKPEITAPDGVNTTFFSSDISQDVDAYPNFFGTSAAAPHAAAVAVLMLSVDSSLTPEQIYDSLEAHATDMGTPGFDNGSGYGLIQADVTPPLPVELISFSAEIIDNAVNLLWKTATEINNSGFEIERTSALTGMNWEKIGFVKGNGNSTLVSKYSFRDNSVKYGKYNYRLKQINMDGTFEYSKSIDVYITKPLNFVVKNFPNPFNPATKITFELPIKSLVNLTVYNLIGQEVATLVNEELEAGIYERDFSLGNLPDGKKDLPSGAYICRLKAGEKTISNKMLLIK